MTLTDVEWGLEAPDLKSGGIWWLLNSSSFQAVPRKGDCLARVARISSEVYFNESRGDGSLPIGTAIYYSTKVKGSWWKRHQPLSIGVKTIYVGKDYYGRPGTWAKFVFVVGGDADFDSWSLDQLVHEIVGDKEIRSFLHENSEGRF